MPLNTILPATPYVPNENVDIAERSALRAVQHLLMAVPELTVAHHRHLLGTALWKWTEASGMTPHPKYNLRYVSRGTLDQDTPAKINHEHVWPRKWLIDRLLADEWAESELGSFLRQYGVACIVTVQEHALLGPAAGEGWERYRNAGVEVFDRLEQKWLTWNKLAPTTGAVEPEPTPDELAEPVVETGSVTTQSTVAEAFQALSGAKAPFLQRLCVAADLAGAVAVVGRTQNPEKPVGDYVRIHDALVPEPTRAVAYVHWSGSVSFALVAEDLSSDLVALDVVRRVRHKTFGIRCKVTDETSLSVATELLTLALEKLRDSFDLMTP